MSLFLFFENWWKEIKFMKINVIYNSNGISIVDILTNDYISFMKKFVLEKEKV